MKELEGRAAFITGGAQGIGLGIARACAASGMKVAIVDIDYPALRDAESELSHTTQVHAVRLDVRDREAFPSVADEVEAAIGPVALLCNNAATGVQTPIERMSYEAWDWVMDINLNGVYNGIQTFLPRMIERGGTAHIVNTASAGGIIASPGYLYACSKFGVVGLSEALRLELSPLNIGISVLCPGPVATNIIKNTLETAPTTKDGSRMTDGAEEYFRFMQQMLATVGRSIDDVGQLVLDAVRRSQFFILTDDTVLAPIQQRTAEITSSAPEGHVVTLTSEIMNSMPIPRE
jgi:NAD(P)-dependent dehydrogenase (short-subunit alcohol dehydrogenase family)